jgi:hypothetical protein
MISEQKNSLRSDLSPQGGADSSCEQANDNECAKGSEQCVHAEVRSTFHDAPRWILLTAKPGFWERTKLAGGHVVQRQLPSGRAYLVVAVEDGS